MQLQLLFAVWVICTVSKVCGDFDSRSSHPCKPKSDGHRIGHLDELGCQRPPLGHITEYFEAPTPRELWENHVLPYKPAVIRGALHGSPALSLWDDSYLIDTYGDQEVLIEKKYEDRKSEPKRMPIRDFINNYRKENWYVVSLLPNAMRRDVRVPKPLMCSTFRKNLAELNLWIGTHGTRSMLHHDADNIMHCVVSGWKDWILIHPDYKSKLDMVVGREAQASGFSHLNVDRIDEDLNPEVWDVPWLYATIRAGDCLYLPYRYLHQVRSYERSISSTFLFYPNDDFSDSDCKDVDLNGYLSLNDTYVYWTYENGQETVDMGYMNPVLVRDEIIAAAKATGKSKINMKMFFYLSLILYGEMGIEAGPRTTVIFKELDHDKDKYITISDMKNADIEIWKQWCRDLDSPHGPTKTQATQSKQLSAETSAFAKRLNDRHVDSRYALYFLQFLLRTKGSNGQITFPEFKKWVEVQVGTPSDAFLLFDHDFNGIVSTQELDNTTQKRLRDFSRMYYSMAGTNINGGGLFSDEVEARDMSFLKDLNQIPKRLLADENDNSAFEIEKFKLQTILDLFKNMKNSVQQGKTMDLKQLLIEVKNSDLLEVFEIEKFDGNIAFSFIDRNDDGVLSIEELDFYMSNDVMNIEEAKDEDPFRANDLIIKMLSNMNMASEYLENLKKRWKQRMKNKDAYEPEEIKTNLKPEKTEL
uniref:uncharacterized protein LOC120328326 n=1 Tax=Styela clava TaxID=7725 RepID=UPI00193AB3EA|nr:uncharacterized protein LOC120328326 [Styela clava]